MKNIVTDVSKVMSRIIAHDKKSGLLITPLFPYRVREYEGDDALAAVSPAYEELYIHQRFGDLSDKDKRFVIYHEAMHIVLGHVTRQGNRDSYRWNVATDLEVNWILKDNGIEPMPNVLYEPRFHGWCAEKIYDVLAQVIPQGGGVVALTKDGKKVQGGVIDSHPEYTGAEKRQAQLAEQTAAVQVEQASRQAGTIPAGIERIIAQLLTPRVPWQQVLLQAVTYQKRDDYSYSRPRRSRLALDQMYFPSLSGTQREVVIIVDTSGSVGQEELTRFLTEVMQVVEMYPTTVLFCDAAVQAVAEEVTDTHALIQKLKGGGGTRFAPAFEWIEENKEGSVAVILMTDGYNDDHGIPIPFNVEQVVVLTTDKVPSGVEPDIVIPIKEEVNV